MEKMPDAFRERLKDMVSKSEYTQKELAQLVGVSEVAFSRYVTGERVPKPQVLANIATALHTTSEYLVNGIEPFAGYEEIYALVARSAKEFSEEQRKNLAALLDVIQKRQEDEEVQH